MWTLSFGSPMPSTCSTRQAGAAPDRAMRSSRLLPHPIFQPFETRPIDTSTRGCERPRGLFGAPSRTALVQPCRATTAAAGAPSNAAPAGELGGSESADPRAARLKAWVLEHSKSLPTQLTAVQRSDGSYSLVTEEPVRRGQALVRVPRRLLLSVETARASEVCGGVVAEAGLNEWQALLLHLLCERALGRRSFWSPYIDTLPTDMSFHPLLWGPERLSWLSGSPLLATLHQRQSQVVEDAEVLAVAGANDLPLAEEWRRETGTELVSPSSVGWAAAVLLSRSFSLDLSEEEPLEGDMGYFGTWTGHAPDVLALVPWADCLTHCSEAGPESCARYQFELGVVTLSAHRDYGVGEAVVDSHGPHLSPVDLFVDYGVEEQQQGQQQQGQGQQGQRQVGGGQASAGAGGAEGLEGGVQGVAAGSSGGSWQRHRFDADPAEVARPRSSRNAALLSALAAVQGEGCRLALGERGPASASLTYLRAALASDVELVRAGWRVKASERDVEQACRAMGALASPSSAATEGALLGALAGFCERQLGVFPTSLEQDLERLEGRGGAERVTGPERLAVVALASQKRALRGTAAAVAAWRAKLADGCPMVDLYDDDDEENGDDWGEEGEEEEEEGGRPG